jgi:hypothetical protein
MDPFDYHSEIAAERRRVHRFMQAMFGVLAVLAVATGLFFYHFAGMVGLDDQGARAIAIAFLLTAIADTALLFGWDALFPAE